MLGYQADPIWILSTNQQRQADLIAEVRQHQLADAAKQYCAARGVRHEHIRRSRFGRIAALIPATLRPNPRIATLVPTPVHGR